MCPFTGLSVVYPPSGSVKIKNKSQTLTPLIAAIEIGNDIWPKTKRFSRVN
jgi:hypothetical protein